MGMNAEIKAQWIRALQGGKYVQGHGQLCAVDVEYTEKHGLSYKTLARKLRAKLSARRTTEQGIKRCCLAVLCDLAARSGQLPDLTVEVIKGEYWKADNVLYDGQAMLLPRSVMEWAGLDEYASGNDGEGYDVRFNMRDVGDEYDEWETLSNLNDGMGRPFTRDPAETPEPWNEGIAEVITRCL